MNLTVPLSHFISPDTIATALNKYLYVLGSQAPSSACLAQALTSLFRNDPIDIGITSPGRWTAQVEGCATIGIEEEVIPLLLGVDRIAHSGVEHRLSEGLYP
jgi:hypothetical protein